MAEVIRGQPLAWYHNSPNVSHSKLRDFATKGARYYHDRYLAGLVQREVTSALVFGEAFEILFQQGGDRFAEVVAVAPAGLDKRTKEGKAFVAATKGKLAIGNDDYLSMLEMSRCIRELPESDLAMLDAGEQQISLVGEAWGLTVQARPDWFCAEALACNGFRPFTVDLKTTRDLVDFLPEQRFRGVMTHGYHTQAALVRRIARELGLDMDHYLLVVEKGQNPRAALVQVASDFLDFGDRWLDAHGPRLAACFQTQLWPRALTERVVAHAPSWADAPHPADNDNSDSETDAA